MARERGGVVEAAPRTLAEPGDDHRLVAAVRSGDDRAFEALYARYHRRIHAYILGMVTDHGRAEDITQEVFFSALRRMRSTERPIAFKPWIYEIAKNACIDQFRRSRRAEEISLHADDGLPPGDHGWLVGSDPAPDAAVAAKQDLDNLCGAFSGLSDTHHEILVLRELEGLSYREIGDRMGMSRPAVESTLFRARRRLVEEYDELVSGARCRRIQSLIAMAGESRLAARETRRVSRHVAHCQPCRREALAAGLDSAILTHVPLRRRAAEKVAALLPFGFLGRWRAGGSGTSAPPASTGGGGGGRWAAQAPMLSEQLQGGWGKLATAAAVLVAGVGAAGVGTQVAGSDQLPRRGDGPADVERAGASAKGAGAGGAERAVVGSPAPTSSSAETSKRQAQNRRTRRPRAERDVDGGGAAQPVRLGPGGGGDGAGGGGAGGPDAGRSVGRMVGGSGAAGGGGLPKVELPAGAQEPATPVQGTVDKVVETVQPVVEDVSDTVQPVVEDVTDTVEPVTEPVRATAEGVGETVGDATRGVLP